MRIGISGHISLASIACYLDGDISQLPQGMEGAPLLGTLIGSLLSRGHTVFAYTTSTDMLVPSRAIANGERFKITFCSARPRAFRYGGGYFGRAADGFRLERALLKEALLEDSPEVVHAHWTYQFALASLESGIPTLITCHDAPHIILKYSPDLYRLVRYFIAKKVFNKACYLTAVSPYLQFELQRYVDVPIVVIPNPLRHLNLPLNSVPKYYNPLAPQIIMILNGWGQRKNPKAALRAFQFLRQDIPNAKLSIIGSDYEVGGKAETWARKNNAANGVSFLGQLEHSLVLTRLLNSDLLLHPALEETFGMSIAEAMSLGLPVVGGESSGAVPWVIGDGGVVVDVRSPMEMAKAMLEILSDPHRRSSMGNIAKTSVMQRFSAEAVAKKYEIEYERVLRGGGC